MDSYTTKAGITVTRGARVGWARLNRDGEREVLEATVEDVQWNAAWVRFKGLEGRYYLPINQMLEVK